MEALPAVKRIAQTGSVEQRDTIGACKKLPGCEITKGSCSKMKRIHRTYAVDKGEQKVSFFFGQAVFTHEVGGRFGTHGKTKEKTCDQTIAATVTDMKRAQ